MFQILLHPQVRIPFVGLWHFSCDLFYCPESAGHGCPSAPSPCHQLWQSQPLFLPWEAAFFQRDDLLCLYRGWHWGRDPARGLDSTRRMPWTKSTSCHPQLCCSYVRQTPFPTPGRELDGSLCSSLLTHQGPATGPPPLTQHNRIRLCVGKWIITNLCEYTSLTLHYFLFYYRINSVLLIQFRVSAEFYHCSTMVYRGKENTNL